MATLARPALARLPAPRGVRPALARAERALVGVLARHGLTLLRLGMGVVFLWFGALKFFPGLSPAADLAARTLGVLTFGLLPEALRLPLLAALECAIGAGLLAGRPLRPVLLLLALQMAGTLTPLALFPGEAFAHGPLVPTLEGQYILKNLVLIGAGAVLGATVRGGRLVAEPAAAPRGPAPPAGPARGSGGARDGAGRRRR